MEGRVVDEQQGDGDEDGRQIDPLAARDEHDEHRPRAQESAQSAEIKVGAAAPTGDAVGDPAAAERAERARAERDDAERDRRARF